MSGSSCWTLWSHCRRSRRGTSVPKVPPVGRRALFSSRCGGKAVAPRAWSASSTATAPQFQPQTALIVARSVQPAAVLSRSHLTISTASCFPATMSIASVEQVNECLWSSFTTSIFFSAAAPSMAFVVQPSERFSRRNLRVEKCPFAAAESAAFVVQLQDISWRSLTVSRSPLLAASSMSVGSTHPSDRCWFRNCNTETCPFLAADSAALSELSAFIECRYSTTAK
mmetsp:Transcript_7395/g.13095  ORF Transcript_7395/g.13095 Transcript_7395/m.13095 type:complete len:226 (+) Transcript_7395:577-1254(+)